MIEVSGMKDMRIFGIELLTGEACAYGMRVLCDVSEEGRTLLCGFLGLSPDTKFAPNWNSFVGETPAVGSIMLPPSIFPELIRYTLFTVADCGFIVGQPGGVFLGVKTTNRYAAGYLELAQKITADGYMIYYRPMGAGSVGGRNVHQMSGRIA